MRVVYPHINKGKTRPYRRRGLGEILLRHEMRRDPIVRWGGDEFVCTISGITTAEAQARIESAQADLHQLEPPVSVTFGLSTTVPHDTLDSVMGRADEAQRQAKEDRRRSGA
jgi:GGDEF domain-containing protein